MVRMVMTGKNIAEMADRFQELHRPYLKTVVVRGLEHIAFRTPFTFIDEISFMPINTFGEHVLRIDCTVPDRDGSGDMVAFVVEKKFAQHTIEHFAPEMVVREVYELVKRVLIHELDEGFYVADKRVFDPHKHDARR
jgi:hypothetical protein